MPVVVSVAVVKSPAKLMSRVAVVLFSTTLVSAFTSLLKLAPLLLVTVKVLSGVFKPTVPPTVMAPVLPAFKVSDCVFASVPSTAPPIVKAAPPVVSDTSFVNVTTVLLSPKVIVAAPLVLIWPAVLMLLGAVAVKPPVKLKLSPTKLPNFKAPVFAKFVTFAPVMLVFAPTNSNT